MHFESIGPPGLDNELGRENVSIRPITQSLQTMGPLRGRSGTQVRREYPCINIPGVGPIRLDFFGESRDLNQPQLMERLGGIQESVHGIVPLVVLEWIQERITT